MEASEWLEQAKQGDPDALNRVLEKYLPKVYHYFCGMGFPAASAEDLTQEAFVEIWRGLAGFQARSSLMGWMMAICRRVAWRRFGGAKKEPEGELIDASDAIFAQLTDTKTNQENLVVAIDRQTKIRQIVYQLPPHYREVIVLHYLEGMTHEAIAKTLEVAVGTIKSRLHRALHLLRPRLEQWDTSTNHLEH